MALNRDQIADMKLRRREVSRLYMQGLEQMEIASEIGCSQSTVSRDLAELRDQWMASALVDINTAKAMELGKIDALELEYWEAWSRSVGESVRETSKLSGPAKGSAEKLEKTITKDKLAGDPRFLAGIQWCIDKRCEILGLDSPQEVVFSWKDEIIDLLRTGAITPDNVRNDFGEGVAIELIERAGVWVGDDSAT